MDTVAKTIGIILLAFGIILLITGIVFSFTIGTIASPIMLSSSILINSVAIMLIRSGRRKK